MDFSNSYNKVKDSVVNILAVVDNRAISSGTGVIVGEGKTVITCAHCILPNTQIFARKSGETIGEIGKVVTIDMEKDIAILSFKKIIGPSVTINDSSNVQVGQEAFVAGYPNNINEITGLSANVAGFHTRGDFDLIRIDCPITHGNSGGPLFNSEGKLIGIINAKHGSLANFLNNLEKLQPCTSSVSSGADYVEAIQKLVLELKTNLNLGIGYVIPTNEIGSISSEIKALIIH